MQKYVVMTRDPMLAASSSPEFAVVSRPMPLQDAESNRSLYAADLGREPSTRDVEVFLARWEVPGVPVRPDATHGFRNSS